MFRKIGLIVFTLASLTTANANWFVGVNGGGNVTRSTPVGDLPMAREEFGVFAFHNSKQSEWISLLTEIMVNQGKTLPELMREAKHLNVVSFDYSIGWDINFYGGYQFDNVSFSLIWSYINSPYKDVSSPEDTIRQFIAEDFHRSKAGLTLNSFLGEVGYVLKTLRFKGLTPILGFGVGVARASNRLIDSQKDVTRRQMIFAYRLKVGAKYSFNKSLEGIIESVFFGTGKIKATNNYLKQGQINLGFRWSFN